jgi:hypothetical protein
MENKKRNKPGRKNVVNPRIYRYSVNFDEMENEKFQALLRRTQTENISKFIASVLLGKEIKVVFIDKVSKDYYMRLTNIYEQYRHIGVNYNQVVKALKTNFAEKRALAMLYRLEKQTIELVRISKEILVITQEYEKKWLQK